MSLPISLSFGGLSPSYCFVSFNKLGADIVAKITATLAGNFTGFAVQKTPPADHTIVWLRTDNDPPAGKVVGIYLWDTTAPAGWTPQDDPSKFLVQNDSGAVNAMIVDYPYDVPATAGVNYRFNLLDGLVLVSKVKVTNTGGVTLNVNGLGAKNVLKQDSTGKVALAAGELQANFDYIFIYDGTQFIVVNPTPVAAGIFVATDANTIAARVALLTPYTVAHGTTPAKIGWVRWSLLCASANGAFAKDDEVDLFSGILVVGSPPTDWDTPFSSFVDANNLGCAVNNECIAPNTINLPQKDATSDFNIDYGKWQLRVRYQILP